MSPSRLIQNFVVPPGKKISLLKDYAANWKPKDMQKKDADELLAAGVQRLSTYQDMLYAQDRHALLVLFQAMDAAGKDGAIKHVMTGVNPQGVQVYSFKAPSPEEMDHDFMWRCMRALPERGRIGIFNRSYYEEVLVVRVHPEILAGQHLPDENKNGNIWHRRFTDINAIEQYLENNGIHVVKIFLNVSKEEQRRRFLARIDHPEKNWKFSSADVGERAHWDEYMEAYEDCFRHTSTEAAPWYIVPADAKWFARVAVAAIIEARLKALNLAYPTITEEEKQKLQQARTALNTES